MLGGRNTTWLSFTWAAKDRAASHGQRPAAATMRERKVKFRDIRDFFTQFYYS